jgi:hypothetical protein
MGEVFLGESVTLQYINVQLTIFKHWEPISKRLYDKNQTLIDLIVFKLFLARSSYTVLLTFLKHFPAI